MWVMLNDAWLSIVVHRDDPLKVMVRARRRGDLNRVFGCPEVETPLGDYRFRATLPRATVAEAMAAEVMRVNYTNFKSSVEDEALHDAYLMVWRAGYALQLDLLSPWRRRGRAAPPPALSSQPSDDVPVPCRECGEDVGESAIASHIDQPADVCTPCWEGAMSGGAQEGEERKVPYRAGDLVPTASEHARDLGRSIRAAEDEARLDGIDAEHTRSVLEVARRREAAKAERKRRKRQRAAKGRKR